MVTSRDLLEVDAARRRLEDGFARLEPDADVAALLCDGEMLLAVRRDVTIQRIGASGVRVADGAATLRGELLVTSQRLVLVDPDARWWIRADLDAGAIREAIATTGLLLLLLDDGAGVAMRVPDPMVLRVELAAARRNVRDQPSVPVSSR
jgi:hypothetical protein